MGDIAQEKLTYEVEKLKAEIRILRKPYLQPTFWIGVLAFALSVAANIGQALTYESRAIIAKGDAAQAKLDMFEMNRKRDVASEELEKLQMGLNEVKGSLVTAKAAASSPQMQATLNEVEKKVTSLEQQSQATANNLDRSESPATGVFRGKLGAAKEKERQGFQSLIDGNYEDAMKSFQASEDSVNTYHSAYEIAELLKKNQSQMHDPAKKKEVLKTIVKEHSYEAPPDLLKQVKVIANQ